MAQGAHRRALRGIGPVLPDPVEGADVSPLCVNVALQIYPDPATLAQTLDRIGDAGFIWLRQMFPWETIEVTPGRYDWEPWDTLVQAVASHPNNLKIIAVLDTAPSWASGNPASRSPDGTKTWDAVPPTDPADLARFASALATRYGDWIDFYQIWDEPNLSSHWGGRDVDPAGYAAMLKAAADAIRASDADGEATILLAGLAPTVETGPRNLSDVHYLRALYEMDARTYFDVVVGKPYGFDTDPGIILSLSQDSMPSVAPVGVLGRS
jgi:hypothetical protein